MEALSKETNKEGSKGSVVISTITPPWSSSLPDKIRSTSLSGGEDNKGDVEVDVMDDLIVVLFKCCSCNLNLLNCPEMIGHKQIQPLTIST